MAEKLVIVSDMWGARKGLWITSYLGYLQQYFDITFYDSQQLANLDLTVNSEENIHNAFIHGGIDTAVAHLLKKEQEPCHYLAFSTGGTIVWNAAKKGLAVKSLYNVSSTRIRMENDKPSVPVTLLYGANDSFRPEDTWADMLGLEMEVMPNYGHTLYSDEKVIKKVCLDLLQQVTKIAAPKTKKAV
jgi:pimeloyl-ACP methyl ester carboxylesterase